MKKYRCGIINKDRSIIKKRSKIIITCTVLIFIIISLMSIVVVATNIQRYTVKIIPSYTNEDDEESYYIKASNYSDYGKQAANRFPYNLVNLIAGEMSSEEEEEIENIIENMSQDFQDKLEGFADNFGITPVRALYLIRTYVSYIPRIEGCTTTLATNEATKEDKTFLTQNLDTNYTNVFKLRLFYRFPWCVTITVPGFYSYACLGWPLILELPLVNEKKIGIWWKWN